MFFFALAALIVLAILFFPIYLEGNAHYDMNRRKLAFSVYAYKILPVFGGYIATYEGGLALHLSKKKAVILPYLKMNSERKRFSVLKSFRWKRLLLTTETGAEYLFLTAATQTLLRMYFFVKGVDGRRVRNNLWLTDGDVLSVSLNTLVYCNLFIILKNFISFCKEKIKELCRRKMKD